MDVVNPEADLKIGISQRGTKFVTARNLHAALRLDPQNYNEDVKKWLADDYGFPDDIRPARSGANGEYSIIGNDEGNSSESRDYFLKLTLAKLITLNSNSPVRKEYARYLLSLEQQVEDADLLSPQQVVALIDVAKVMGLISCQTAAEAQHYSTYLEKGNIKHTWWDFRARLLGYTTEDLRNAMLKMGRNAARRNRRQIIMQTDKYELIRAAVIDLFSALGKNTKYSINMGELAYKFATEMKIPIWDDRNLSIDFTQNLDQDLIHEVQALQKKGFMGLW